MATLVSRVSRVSARGASGARRALAALGCAVAAAGLLSGCGYGSEAAMAPGGGAVVPSSGRSGPALSASTVRIGYFANLTHATPLIGIQDGQFARDLGRTRISTQIFDAGPSEIEALNSGAIDIAWVGPSPAINGYAKSHGAALKIISGATSGGAELVVNPRTIRTAADLRGKRIATPQAGNTQDVALLDYLAGKGYQEDPKTGAGDVSVIRADDSITPSAYASGQIDGAWVPEPTASELVSEGARPLIDERTLWPEGQFASTEVVVSQSFLAAHPDVVKAVLKASVDTNAWILANPAGAQREADAALTALTGKGLRPEVLRAAWSEMTVTDDPLAATLTTEAQHAVTAGFITRPGLSGICDLTLLNQLLSSEGKPTVSAAGLGAQ